MFRDGAAKHPTPHLITLEYQVPPKITHWQVTL